MNSPPRFLVAVFALLTIAAILPASERDRVIYVDGCSAFVLQPDLLVTAKHCQFAEQLPVTIQGKQVTARKLATARGADGPVIYELPGGPFDGFPLATMPPESGDRIRSLGYPGGNWAEIEGEIIGGNGRDENYAALRFNPGHSGGPVLNTSGEVVGVALHVDEDLQSNQSGMSGFNVLAQLQVEARQKTGTQQPYQRANTARRVVAFVLTNCRPCAKLKSDVAAGLYPAFNFEFVTYDEQLRQWDKPGVYADFVAECRPTTSLAAPTIWVPGSGEFKSGYDQPGPLVGWIDNVVRSILNIPKPRLPPPSTAPPAVPPAAIATPLPASEPPLQLLSDVNDLKSSLATIREEVENARAEDVTIAKRFAAIEAIVAEIKAAKPKAQTVIREAKKARDDPFGYALGALFGLLTCSAQTVLELKPKANA